MAWDFPEEKALDAEKVKPIKPSEEQSRRNRAIYRAIYGRIHRKKKI